MNDSQVIRGIEDGDEAAIHHVIHKYSRLLWHIAGAVMKHAASAEEIEECVADVFVYLWQNHARYDPRRGTLKSWLSTVAKSKAIDRYRRLSKLHEVSLNDALLTETVGVVDNILTAELQRELLAAVEALGELDREIVVRRYYHRQKPKDIGFALDLPVKQVENRLYRSKLKLRSAIACGNGRSFR